MGGQDVMCIIYSYYFINAVKTTFWISFSFDKHWWYERTIFLSRNCRKKKRWRQGVPFFFCLTNTTRNTTTTAMTTTTTVLNPIESYTCKGKESHGINISNIPIIKSSPIETPTARIPDFADSRRKLFMLKFTRLLHTTVVSLKHNGRLPSCMQDGQKGEHHNVGTLGSSTLKIVTNGCLGGEYIRRPLLCLQSAENYFYIISYLLPSSSAILRFIFSFIFIFL